MASASARITLFFFTALLAQLLTAQVSGPISVSGVVTDKPGAALQGTKVSARNLQTGEIKDTITDSAGHFVIAGLTPGEYEVSASATSFISQTIPVKLTEGVPQTLNFFLASATAPATNLPDTPSASQSGPSLSELGFPPEDTQSNAKRQALLDKRAHMLKIHQKLGLITTAPLVATLVASMGAGGKSTSSTDRTVHMVLGAVTSDLYFTSAYFAIRAPRVPGTTTRPDPPPQGASLGSWTRHDSDAHPGSYRLRPEKQGREGSWHCLGARACCRSDGCRFRNGSALGLCQVLKCPCSKSSRESDWLRYCRFTLCRQSMGVG
jgi:Carboxypeptidase regulatory-like domain